MFVLALSAIAVMSGPPEPRVPPRVSVLVTSPQVAQKHRYPPAFRATKILEVQFDAVFARRLKGQHVLEFKVYTPRGHLYQVLTVPFTGDPRLRGLHYRQMHNYPRGLLEKDMRAAGPYAYHVSARLPVGGTWIMTNSLYGSWRVDAYLDRAVRPAGGARFTIQP